MRPRESPRASLLKPFLVRGRAELDDKQVPQAVALDEHPSDPASTAAAECYDTGYQQGTAIDGGRSADVRFRIGHRARAWIDARKRR